jgi:hypothetical protein
MRGVIPSYPATYVVMMRLMVQRAHYWAFYVLVAVQDTLASKQRRYCRNVRMWNGDRNKSTFVWVYV